MKRNLLLLLLISFSISYGQFNENAPWMKDLKKKETSFSKSQGANGKLVYTFAEITQAFDNYWKDKDKNAKSVGYKPFMRWRNYWQHFVKPDGYLPTGKELWEAYQAHQQFAGPVNPTSNWTTLGPVAPETSAFGQPGVGRINAIAVDPNNADIYYAGAPTGGLWKSLDAGNTWLELFQEFPQVGVSGIAIDPNDSNIVYIATGDDDAGNSFSIGVFKSTDGGATWSPTGLGPDETQNFDQLNEIVIDPTDSNVLWVGGTQGLLKSEDAGVTWEVKQIGNITDFAFKPGDFSVIYAVTGQTRTTGTTVVDYLRSDDGGETFEEITENLPADGGRAVIGVSPDDPDVVYLLYSDIFDCDNDCFQGLFKSTDSGETFVQTDNTVNLMERDQAWYDLAIAVSPTDVDEVYTGAINIWKSSDGGDSFIRLNSNDDNVGPAYTHVDIHTLKFFNGSLYTGTDGGFYVSSDGGASFQDKSDGLDITQFYRIGIAKNNADRIAGGTQDNSGFVYDSDDWTIYTGADGMDYEIDPTNSNIVYGFPQFGGTLFVTTNFGQTAGNVGAPGNGNWVTPLALDGDGTVYAAYDAVYRLDGNQFTQVSDTFADGENIDDLEIDPNNPLVMYAANRGVLYRSEDGGVTFTVLNDIDPGTDEIIPFNSQISDIAINDNNGNIVYLTTAGTVGITPEASQDPSRGVFRVTVDGDNVTIEDITYDLPAGETYFSIVHQPRDANNPIFVGTSLGIYRTDDTLTEWEQYSTNLPNIAIADLEISPDDETIVAGSYGRGAWVSPIPVTPPSDDVKLVSLELSAGSVACEDVTPSLTVENKGANAITQVDVVYTINDGPDQDFTYTTNLASGSSESFDLPVITGDTGELIELDVNVSVANDAFSDNNAQKDSYLINESGAGDQLFDFETPESSLFAFDLVAGTPLTSDGVWEVGVPTGTLLNTASSGTQVIGTNLDGDHPNETTGVIYSRCYDLSSLLAPKLSFQMAFELEDNWDVVYVIYSTDNFETFEVLGSVDSEPNWYNSNRTNASSGGADCFNCPGAQWTGTDPANAIMTEYAYDFTANAGRGETDLTGETNIIFGIVFVSDQAVVEEGAVIDDFVVEGFVDDEDDDNDGILDVDDNCPLVANADQADNDGDSEGDVCDDDDDNDGVRDLEDICPLTPNADQADFDGDGIGDVCDDDIDNDGVPNALDLCDETPTGTVVDVDGCPIFTLPANNFSLKTIGASCIGNQNGAIEINAATALDYNAGLLDGETILAGEFFTDQVIFENLAPGNYTVCMSVQGQPSYEQCFDVTITEPEALDVGSKVSSLSNEVTLSLSGGKEYLIELNGEAYITSESEITLPLNKVENILTVRTDKDCQGTHTETIVLSNKIFIYPNPNTDGELNVYLGSSEFEEVNMSIFTTTGVQVFNKPFRPESGYVRMNVSNLPEGIYLLNIKTNYSLLNYKIIMR